LFLEVFGARPQRLVGERFELFLQRVDRVDLRLIATDPPFIGGAEQLAGDGADHASSSSIMPGVFSTPPRPDLASGAPEMRHFSGKFDANTPAKLNQPRSSER